MQALELVAGGDDSRARRYADARSASGERWSFVTVSTYGEQARAEAQLFRLTLADGRDLYGRVEKARCTEPCPPSPTPMLLDRSSRGWWLR